MCQKFSFSVFSEETANAVLQLLAYSISFARYELLKMLHKNEQNMPND